MTLAADEARIYPLTAGGPVPGAPVVYWMSRDQRASDNWALLHAQDLACRAGSPLIVLFCCVPDYPSATPDAFAFLLAGLQETLAGLTRLNIPMVFLHGQPPAVLPPFLAGVRAGMLVADFDPLRHKQRWLRAVANATGLAVHEVDSHNLVPCRYVSDHAEIGARTLRPKIDRALARFLKPYPALRPHPHAYPGALPHPGHDLIAALLHARARSTQDLAWAPPGPAAGLAVLARFLRNGLPRYAAAANDPLADATSELSPYLHFGQLSAQRVALTVTQADAPPEAQAKFLEQLVVRRELADNFCLHTTGYDTPAAAPRWARQTLAAHGADPRPYRYTPEQLRAAATHDLLWNAAQTQMVGEGRLHGYLRMYWAKKILEWSSCADEAQATALAFNDRYFLDGRDPNGYTNVAWSLFGLHDRPWPERPITGMVRCMTLGGCRSKFDVDGYIRRVPDRAQGPASATHSGSRTSSR